jgi:tetratricopeptide repeat protein 21B
MTAGTLFSLQLEFVRELQATMKPTAGMALNHALIAWRRRGSADEAVALLDEAVEAHMGLIRRLPYDMEYFVALNPDLLLEIAREYLRHAGEESRDEHSLAAAALTKATKLLHIVAAQVPGLLDGQIHLARALKLKGDHDGALRCCAVCTKADPSQAEAALLQASILVKLEKHRQASAVLDQVIIIKSSVIIIKISQAREAQTGLCGARPGDYN